jgi:hypothetical protein
MTLAAHLGTIELAVRRGLATFIAGSMIFTSAMPAFAQEAQETEAPKPVIATTTTTTPVVVKVKKTGPSSTPKGNKGGKGGDRDDVMTPNF